MANHESVIKLLTDNGADICSGDVGQFACTAAEQNKLEWLEEIVRYGGDVTLPKINRSTALHVAVCEGNTKMVKYLLDRGADIDKPDDYGWTPRDLADQQGHEDIKILFDSSKEAKTQSSVAVPEEEPRTVRFLGRFESEPTILPGGGGGGGTSPAVVAAGRSWGRSRPRRMTNNFHNSLFGIMSAARGGATDVLLSSVKLTKCGAESGGQGSARVTVSCPEKGDVKGKLILLPKSFQELLEIGAKKYGFLPAKVLSKEGADIDEIEVIRDGDHVVFVSDDIDSSKFQEPCNPNGVSFQTSV